MLATMQAGQSAEMAQRLVAATAAITPFDEAVATPEQKEALAKARPAVKTLAWALMQERVNILAQGETPQAAEAVAGVYQLVKDIPAAELTAPQRGLLAKGAAAAVAVAASNDRLNDLVVAADKWRRRSGPVDRCAIAARQAITPFDQKRFQDRSQGGLGHVIARGSDHPWTRAWPDRANQGPGRDLRVLLAASPT